MLELVHQILNFQSKVGLRSSHGTQMTACNCVVKLNAKSLRAALTEVVWERLGRTDVACALGNVCEVAHDRT